MTVLESRRVLLGRSELAVESTSTSVPPVRVTKSTVPEQSAQLTESGLPTGDNVDSRVVQSGLRVGATELL